MPPTAATGGISGGCVFVWCLCSTATGDLDLGWSALKWCSSPLGKSSAWYGLSQLSPPDPARRHQSTFAAASLHAANRHLQETGSLAIAPTDVVEQEPAFAICCAVLCCSDRKRRATLCFWALRRQRIDHQRATTSLLARTRTANPARSRIHAYLNIHCTCTAPAWTIALSRNYRATPTPRRIAHPRAASPHLPLFRQGAHDTTNTPSPPFSHSATTSCHDSTVLVSQYQHQHTPGAEFERTCRTRAGRRGRRG